MPDTINILLVDDQPARLLSYEAILGELGANLVPVRSGTEALAKLIESEFAVILLDVNMPDMDGFETANLIHQHPRHERTPIIFVTGVHMTDMDRLRGYDAGAVDYVFVPVSPPILRGKVTVLCELYRQRRELQRLNATLASANEKLSAANADLQAERALELRALNEALERTNRDLAHTNVNLQAEIAERRRIEDKLREADRRKDEFLATLAHELRNPLAPIRHALSQVTAVPSRDGIDAVQIMQRQLRHLVRLIDDLLDVSRITRGKLEMRKRPVELRAVLENAIETVRPQLIEAGQQLQADLSPAMRHLDADPVRLAQVFANLLNNASKYSEPGSTLRIEVAGNDEIAQVSIIDSGIGIASDQLERIFEPFVQVDTSLERQRGGLGIGLTLVRQLVEMHCGRITAISGGLGQGSTFCVELPLHLGHALPAPPTATALAPQADAAPVVGKRRILVVDDNRDAADTLALSLQLLGHEVRTVYDPLQALDIAVSYRPDLVFMDVGMPRLNGYDLAARMRTQEWSRDTLMVALTGWGQDDDRRRSQLAGLDHHLVKPTEFAEIERMCRTRRVARRSETEAQSVSPAMAAARRDA